MTIYDQLNTKTLGNVEANDIQSLQNRVHIQEVNKEELETYNLINTASFRDGKPMPESGAIKVYVQTDDSDYQYFQPPKGEIWQILGISALNSAALTGSTNAYTFYLANADNASLGDSLYFSQATSASTNVPFEVLLEKANYPLIIDYNCFLLAFSNMSNSAVGATVGWKVGYIRLR